MTIGRRSFVTISSIGVAGCAFGRLPLLGQVATQTPLHTSPQPVSPQRGDKATATPPARFARQVADYICNVRFEDLDRAAVDHAKEHLIYHVGLAFTGALTEPGHQAIEIARMLSEGRGHTTIAGQSFKVPPLEAAFANCTFMRALGLDDVLFPSATHPGILIYPVALALGEQYHRSGKDLLTALITGYEVLGKMITVDAQMSRAPRRPSMPFGPFGATAVAIKLMRLNSQQAANAIGYAADTAMGLQEGNESLPTHQYSWVCRNGITAAILAEAGGETAPTILEGKYGFYATLLGDIPDVDAVISRLGKDPEILRATQKRYPGTAMNIVPIQLLLEMIERERLEASNVARVEIELPDDRQNFEDSYSTGPFPTRTQAASSVAFQTAIILLDGHIDFARYDQREKPEILAQVRKIKITLAPHKNTRYARLRITTVDGRSLEREGDNYVFPRLDGSAWLSKDGEKFVPRAKLTHFAELVRDLENVSDIGELMACLVPA